CTQPSFSFSTRSAPPDLYTLSLHDALPIFDIVADDRRKLSQSRFAAPFRLVHQSLPQRGIMFFPAEQTEMRPQQSRRKVARHKRDRKSTRLNSSHVKISYAVFCLKKKTKQQ